MNNKKKIKIAIIVLAVLLGISITMLIGTLIYNRFASDKETSVTVSDNTITPDPSENETSKNSSLNSEIQSQTSGKASQTIHNQSGDKGNPLSLYKNKPEDSTPFAVKNMFPGDSETKNYYVSVSHKGDVTLKYHADIHKGSEKLSKALKIKIVMPSKDKVIYDGVIKDMPTSLDILLETAKPTESIVDYEITAYLETSVGNEYMNTELIADFKWWVEETENLYSPKTGDSSNIILWSGIALGSLILLILLWKKRKKEDAGNER